MNTALEAKAQRDGLLNAVHEWFTTCGPSLRGVPADDPKEYLFCEFPFAPPSEQEWLPFARLQVIEDAQGPLVIVHLEAFVQYPELKKQLSFDARACLREEGDFYLRPGDKQAVGRIIGAIVTAYTQYKQSHPEEQIFDRIRALMEEYAEVPPLMPMADEPEVFHLMWQSDLVPRDWANEEDFAGLQVGLGFTILHLGALSLNPELAQQFPPALRTRIEQDGSICFGRGDEELTEYVREALAITFDFYQRLLRQTLVEIYERLKTCLLQYVPPFDFQDNATDTEGASPFLYVYPSSQQAAVLSGWPYFATLNLQEGYIRLCLSALSLRKVREGREQMPLWQQKRLEKMSMVRGYQREVRFTAGDAMWVSYFATLAGWEFAYFQEKGWV